MARTYLDYDGLLYFWEKLKSKLSTELSEKVDKVSGKGLSSNDLTDALVTKINQAEKNVITDRRGRQRGDPHPGRPGQRQ